jgi:hypothetical protein
MSLWGFVITASLLCGIPSISRAQTPLFGICFFDQGYAGSLDEPGVNYQDLKRLSFGSQLTATDPASGSTNSLQGAVSKGKLYGYAQASAGTEFQTSSYVGMDSYFFDTFYITGPAGATGQFTLNLTLNGTVTGTCVSSPQGCQVDDLIDNFVVLENCTANPAQCGSVVGLVQKNLGSPNHQSVEVTVSFPAGTSVVLGGLLQLRDLVQNENPGGGGSLTFMGGKSTYQTGFFTFAPVTPGFMFTTASGLTYAAATQDALDDAE